MGLTDMMKQSNQSSNEDVVDVFPGGEDHKTAKKDGAAKIRAQPAVIPSDGNGAANMLSNAMWSSDGLLSSTRLFQRSNSTPPTHVDAFHGNQRQVQNTNDAYKFNRFHLRETVEENNQEDDVEDLDRHDLVMPIGKHIQRAWSAPPVPHNFDAFFAQRSSENDKQRTRMAALEKTGLRGIAEDARPAWNDGGCDSGKTQEKTGINTISPADSPSAIDHQLDNECTLNGAKRNSSLAQRGFFPASKRPNPSLMTLVDRVQEDFPRTPSPVFGCPASPTVVIPNRSLDQSMSAAMKELHVDGHARANTHHHSFPRNDRAFAPPAYQQRVHDFRQAHRVQNHVSYTSSYPVVTPPGFHGSSTARGIYGGTISNDPRAPWANSDDHRGFPGSRFPAGPMDYGMMASTARVPHKGDFYPNRFGGGLYTPHEAPSRPYHGHSQPIFPTPQGYDIHDHHMYIPHPAPVYRSKSGPVRHHDYGIHPAHSYSSTSLLEEFKGAAKSDRWDLRTIQGHLLEFARDQAGSRFIQQKLEKADDRVRDDAFNEVFPEALLLMTDVFGNYVIQKFFDHGSLDQQHRLVGLMKKNMIILALQVYGCRVIQKALEASQVEEQLMLIQEMRGHVLKCVVDQNGNHVLQKCIEAASWKNCMNGGGAQHNVLGEDIQFIIDDFVGQAASLSTHAYGCRVIQRVLEHCTPEQIRPIVNEIIYKCRELVKDQFGNYVVQHVVTHGEKDQRDIVMKAILPDVAKWSQHKYASNVVEACLDCATKEEISQVIDIILDCDESGSSCALLPMMKHMYGNYVVQKLLDRAERNDRQRIVRIIQHNADYLKRFTYGKHVLSRLERESNSNHREHGHSRFF